MTSLMKTCGGLRPPHPPSQYTFIPGACGPRTPAIYPSNPQNPQTHFYRHSNGVLVANHYLHTWNLNCADLERAQVECAEVERAQVECADLCRAPSERINN